MNWRTHLIFWVAPAAIIGVLIAMYFSDIRWLMTIVAPEVNRELGLLEGLQNLVLLVILGMTAMRAYDSDTPIERGVFLVFVAGTLFMLLEELDYGTHYWWALQGWDMEARPTVSLHNIEGDRYLDFYKKGGDMVMTLWFVLFPWVARNVRNVWVQFLRPRPMFGLAFIVAVLLSDVAHYFSDHYPPEPHYLDATIGEFRELFTYYIWLLYFGTLARLRHWPAAERRPG